MWIISITCVGTTEGDRPGRAGRDLLGDMTIERWVPSQSYTRQETAILKSLRRTRKLFAFLRDHRHELFNDEMRDALEFRTDSGVCDDTGESSG
jgi:hypothetical protein